MSHFETIKSLTKAVSDSSDKICMIVEALEGMSPVQSVNDLYEVMLFDELNHVQMITLEMTKMLTGSENADGETAFSEGELTDVLGEKDVENPSDAN